MKGYKCGTAKPVKYTKYISVLTAVVKLVSFFRKTFLCIRLFRVWLNGQWNLRFYEMYADSRLLSSFVFRLVNVVIIVFRLFVVTRLVVWILSKHMLITILTNEKSNRSDTNMLLVFLLLSSCVSCAAIGTTSAYLLCHTVPHAFKMCIQNVVCPFDYYSMRNKKTLLPLAITQFHIELLSELTSTFTPTKNCDDFADSVERVLSCIYL